MLTKCVDNSSEKTADPYGPRRSDRIIMTNEARVLKAMRMAAGLSMRKAGSLIGRSDSYIAHLETGRMDPPTESKLEQLLAIYGGIKSKSFYEKVRNYKERIGPKDELLELISHMNDNTVKMVLAITKNLMG